MCVNFGKSKTLATAEVPGEKPPSSPTCVIAQLWQTRLALISTVLIRQGKDNRRFVTKDTHCTWKLRAKLPQIKLTQFFQIPDITFPYVISGAKLMTTRHGHEQLEEQTSELST